jgi:hypothetical protein
MILTMLSNKGISPGLVAFLRSMRNRKVNKTRRNNMFLLNNKSRVLKYKNDVLTVNPQMIEKVAQYAFES